MAQSCATNAPLKWYNKSSLRASWRRRHAKWRQTPNTSNPQEASQHTPSHSIPQLPPGQWRNNKPAAWAHANKGKMSKTDDDVGALVVPDQVHSSRLTWSQFTNGIVHGLELAQVATATPPAATSATIANVRHPDASGRANGELNREPAPATKATDRDIALSRLKSALRIEVPIERAHEVDNQIDRRGSIQVKSGPERATMSSSAIMLARARSARRSLDLSELQIGQLLVVTRTCTANSEGAPICMSESSREAQLKLAQATGMTTITGIKHEQFHNKPANCKPVRLIFLLLAFGLLLLWRPPTRAHLLASATQTNYDHHLNLWLSILARLHGDRQRQATDELAKRLANWPQSHEAALFYVEQLAKKLDEEEAAVGAARKDGAEKSSFCSSVSLAALMVPRPPYASDLPTPESDPVDRDDLSSGRVWPAEMARHLQVSAGQLSRMAVDNANLITRLLLMDGGRRHRAETSPNNLAGQILAQQPFEQVEALLHRLVGPQLLDFMLNYKVDEFRFSSNSSKSPEMLQLRGRLHSIGLVLFTGERPSSRASGPNGSVPSLAYWKVALISDHTPVKLIDLLRHGQRAATDDEAELMPSPILKWIQQANDDELLGRLNERLLPMTRAMEDTRNNKTGGREQEHLSGADGAWFSPHVHCDTSSRWLLTYSIPFFSMGPIGEPGQTPPQEDKKLQMRGVSYVNLDLASMGPLISPCAAANNEEDDTQQQTPSFLANTSKCHLIGSSQTNPNVAPNSRPQFRPGAYVCQCPTRWPRLSRSDRQATQTYRRRLIRLLNSQEANNNLASSLLSNSVWPDNDDNLANGNHFGPADRQSVAELLAKRNGQQQPKFDVPAGLNEETSTTPMRAATKSFVLGAELEFEAALNMLTGSSGVTAGNDRSRGQDSPSEWRPPERSCRACREMAGTRANLQASGGDDHDDDLDCQPSEMMITMGQTAASRGVFVRYIRPLVLICQVVCIVITLALIGVILRIRKSRTIIVSGWVMLETMLVGALLLHVSVLVRYFQATSLTCLLGPWLRELGFSIFYGSILIKLYRMLTEFQTRKAHRVCMRDKDQIIYLAAIVLIVIGYMSAWTALMVDSFFVRQAPKSPAELATSAGDISSWMQGPNEADARQQQQQPQIERRHTFELASGMNHEPASELLASSDYNELAKSGDGDDDDDKNRHRKRSSTSEIRLEPGNRFVNSPARRQEFEWLRGVAAAGANEASARKVRHLVTSDSSSGNRGDGNLLDGHFEILARGLNSFGQLFLGLLETEHRFDLERDSFVYLVRCRKLTWDYVTESGEIALLLFGLNLVYKLRNASVEVNKEKLILGFGLLIELIASSLVYLIRHSLWHQLTSDHLLALNALRCQLSVTLTVVLVFAPKLRDIGKSKPGLLVSAVCGRWALEFLLENCACEMLRPTAGSSAGLSVSSSGGAAASINSGGGGAGGQPGCGKQRGASVRHRCHISCEEHDHHLNDATRLHQAMLSNSALEIGSINLADMDPDEIQAELKRVYTQLELLKTKVMRRDNPHISKRRGGRKPGHRKFSLQAFHGRHSSTTAATPAESLNDSQLVQQQPAAAAASAAQTNCDKTTNQVNAAGNLNDDGELPSGSKQQQQQHNSTIKRLPAVTELDGESLPAPLGIYDSNPEERLQTYMHTIKHVRLDESRPSQETTHKHTQSTRQTNAAARSGKLSFSILAKRSHASSSGGTITTTNKHRNAAAADHSMAKWTPELPSTSSLGYDEDALMNDSQSSGETTPQHRSSIIYNHQS